MTSDSNNSPPLKSLRWCGELAPTRDQPFRDLRVWVTGGGTGIGRATALALSRDGAIVGIVGRRKDALADVARVGGGRIVAIPCDVRDSNKWIGLLQENTPHILINNAAVSLGTNVENPDDPSWSELMAVTFEATRVGCLEAAKAMRDRGGGRIVNVTSVHGKICEKGSAAYGVGKAAVEHLTRSLAVEFARDGILVNAVAPGFVDTPMSRAHGRNELETDWFRTLYIESGRIPMGRPAQPEEVAEAICFLASPFNTYVTGQVLTVDGGLTLTL